MAAKELDSFRLTSNSQHLERSHVFFLEAAKGYEESHYKVPYIYTNLANVAWKLAELKGETPDADTLRTIISNAEKAKSLTDKEDADELLGYASLCKNIGTYYRSLYLLTKDDKEKKGALEHHETAHSIISKFCIDNEQPNYPPLKYALIELATTRRTIANMTRDEAQLKQAIADLSDAQGIESNDDGLAHVLCLRELGAAYELRVYLDRDGSDMTEAISYYQAALVAAAECGSATRERAYILGKLSMALSQRNGAGDLEEAIGRVREASAIYDAVGGKDPVSLYRLGNLLWRRFDHTYGEGAQTSSSAMTKEATQDLRDALELYKASYAELSTEKKIRALFDIALLHFNLWELPLARDDDDLNHSETFARLAKEAWPDDCRGGELRGEQQLKESDVDDLLKEIATLRIPVGSGRRAPRRQQTVTLAAHVPDAVR